MKFRNLLLAAALLAAALAPFAAPAQERSVSVTGEIVPARDVFYVGESAEYVLTLRYVECEPTQRLFIDGMPNSSVFAERQHRFRSLSQPVPDVDSEGRNRITLRIAAPLHFQNPGQVTLAPRVGGMAGRTVRRGFASTQYQETFRTVDVPPVAFAVKALPAPAPETFCGAVGEFGLEAEVQPNEAAPGDLVTLEWRLTSAVDRDSLASVRPVALSAPGFRSYPPREKAVGRREAAFTQVFVPETLASTNIPPLRVTVFDTATGAYRTLEAGPFALSLVERESLDAKRAAEEAPAPEAQPESVSKEASGERVESAEVGDTVTFARDRVSRLCPSAASRDIGTVPAGTALRVLEKSGGWIRVAPGGGGVSAWVTLEEE